MREDLHRIAKEYVELVEKIERTQEPKKVQSLEEMRVQLHWIFMEALKTHGIKFNDRDHAARIAIRVAKEEL